MRVFARATEITDSLGGRLKVCLEDQAQGAVILLERPDLRGRPRAQLDGYGAELLWGYIMAARIAGPHLLPDECTQGACATRLRLIAEPRPAISIIQADLERPFDIPATLWDQLYAQLCLVMAHVRELGRRVAQPT